MTSSSSAADLKGNIFGRNFYHPSHSIIAFMLRSYGSGGPKRQKKTLVSLFTKQFKRFLFSNFVFLKQNHLASCPLQVVSCTNGNCDVRLPRKDLQGHVTSSCEWKVLHCSHCGVSHAACKAKVRN